MRPYNCSNDCWLSAADWLESVPAAATSSLSNLRKAFIERFYSSNVFRWRQAASIWSRQQAKVEKVDTYITDIAITVPIKDEDFIRFALITGLQLSIAQTALLLGPRGLAVMCSAHHTEYECPGSIPGLAEHTHAERLGQAVKPLLPGRWFFGACLRLPVYRLNYIVDSSYVMLLCLLYYYSLRTGVWLYSTLQLYMIPYVYCYILITQTTSSSSQPVSTVKLRWSAIRMSFSFMHRFVCRSRQFDNVTTLFVWVYPTQQWSIRDMRLAVRKKTVQ